MDNINVKLRVVGRRVNYSILDKKILYNPDSGPVFYQAPEKALKYETFDGISHYFNLLS